MQVKPLYQVLLLPSREVAARHQTLGEASAWVRTYNEALAAPQLRAVIAEEPAERFAPPAQPQAA
ncbi:MAG: hypothetical protein K8R36_09310 [Planctomycetales bacterium]|nr:hypothetical protein [Planctomycetales bacterium]